MVAEPVQQLGKSPLRRVDATAPLDGFQTLAPSRFGDLGGFPLRSVVTPQVILTQRLEIFAHRNHRGTGGIERDRLYLAAWDAGGLQDLAGG